MIRVATESISIWTMLISLLYNLPYGNGSYSMTVILPNRGKSIDEVMAGLDAKKVGELRRSMDECVVEPKFPRFTISQETSLNDIISKLGAPTMFTSGADFSNFASGNLSISKMLQKAKIEVSEEGTKASAVTMAMVAMARLCAMSQRKVKFHANTSIHLYDYGAQHGCHLVYGTIYRVLNCKTLYI